jgi:RNA-directed DNA polymerase
LGGDGECRAPGGKDERGPLSIRSVRDRIVPAAVKIVLEPIFEADMADCSFGFRPRGSAHVALQVLIDECYRGCRWVVETDIANCFSAIPHKELMQAIEERVCGQTIVKLLGVILRAGVMEEGQVRRPVAGTPQGGVASPLLCDLYLHRLDRAWDEADGVLVRYAGDVSVMCWSRSQAGRALVRLTGLLAELGLEPKQAKTRIVHLQPGGEGLDFLGFDHRLVRSPGLNGKRRVVFLARGPVDRAMQHARDRVRELTRRSRLLLPVEVIVADLNRFLSGWAAYFRFGNSAKHFNKIRSYARMRMAIFLSKRHRRSREFGWSVVAFQSPNQLGLITLSGIVVAPRPFRVWLPPHRTVRAVLRHTARRKKDLGPYRQEPPPRQLPTLHGVRWLRPAWWPGSFLVLISFGGHGWSPRGPHDLKLQLPIAATRGGAIGPLPRM